MKRMRVATGLIVVVLSVAATMRPAGAVVFPPSINTSFGQTAIALNASTSLSFAIYNPNLGIGLTNVGFTEPATGCHHVPVSPSTAFAGTCPLNVVADDVASGYETFPVVNSVNARCA